MKKWEYLEKNRLYVDFDELGEKGWELVAVSGDWLYFKRQIK